MSASGIIGYVGPSTCNPGIETAVKVSCEKNSSISRVYRLLAGYEHPDAPPVSHQLVKSIPLESHKGQLYYNYIGSFARVESWRDSDIDDVDALSISFCCQATLPEEATHEQYMFSSIDRKINSGFECFEMRVAVCFFALGPLTRYRRLH